MMYVPLNTVGWYLRKSSFSYKTSNEPRLRLNRAFSAGGLAGARSGSVQAAPVKPASQAQRLAVQLPSSLGSQEVMYEQHDFRSGTSRASVPYLAAHTLIVLQYGYSNLHIHMAYITVVLARMGYSSTFGISVLPTKSEPSEQPAVRRRGAAGATVSAAGGTAPARAGRGDGEWPQRHHECGRHRRHRSAELGPSNLPSLLECYLPLCRGTDVRATLE